MTARRLAVLVALLLLVPRVHAQESEMEEELKEKRNVILLGKTQLLNDARAYPKFCEQNANRKRSELRKEIVAKLKQIAAREQPKILKALGDPEGARSLWVVNAVAVSLTPVQIEHAKKL